MPCFPCSQSPSPLRWPSASAGSARAQSGRAQRSRLDLRRAAGRRVAAEVPTSKDLVQPHRERRRHPGDLDQDRRLRRERCAADARPVQHVRRLRRAAPGRSPPRPSCTTCPGSRTTCTSRVPIIAGIYLGQIKKWNDPKIKAVNRGVNLPSLDITPVYRSDSSGTSFNFTTYLNTVSKQWKSRIGRGTTVNWPAGVGARGSSGVSGVVSRTPGAVGYADIAYSLKNHLKFFSVQNRAQEVRTAGSRRHQGGLAGRPEVQRARTSCRS